MNESLVQHKMRNDLNLVEDPWENYIAYDAKYFLPMINHQNSLKIADQIVLFKFVLQSIKTETISEYIDKPMVTVAKLFEFAKKTELRAGGSNIFEILEDLIEHEEQSLKEFDGYMERLCRMFYLD